MVELDKGTATARQTETDDDGEFSFDSVAAGAHTLDAVKGSCIAAQIPIEIAANGTLEVNITLVCPKDDDD